MKHLQLILQSNPPSHFLIALGAAIIIFIALSGLRRFAPTYIRHIANRISAYWGDILVETIGMIKTPVLFSLSFLLGLLCLEMSGDLRRAVVHAAIIVFLYQFGSSLSKGIFIWASRKNDAQRESGGETDSNNYAIISFVLRLTVWIIVFLLVLDNLGVNVTALVASLGIGGVAIALAVQNILGDIFASLSIALDKPFLVGDFIVVDSLSGTVKHIGLKTTRITSITGEELVISNADLLKSRIHNYKKMEARRIVFTLGVTFDTSLEKLKRIPGIVRDIFNDIQTVHLDRVHFARIGESSLEFEIVYYVNAADYNVYVDAQHAFNLAAMDAFRKEDIDFAFPTQTLHISRKRQTEASQ